MAANRHRSYSRRSSEKKRDARLFVIATEDTYAAKQYFSAFEGVSQRVKIMVFETTDNRSSPQHVIDRLIKYKRDEELDKDDCLWALLDTDHWVEPNHVSRLVEARKCAKENDIMVAMSNPCFDLWLLLHHMDLPDDHGILDGKGVTDFMRRNGVPFNKLRLELKDYGPEAVRRAIERAGRLMGLGPQSPSGWPQSAGTQVHLLLEELLKSGIVLG